MVTILNSWRKRELLAAAKVAAVRRLRLVPLKLCKLEEVPAWESDGHDGGDLNWGAQDGYRFIAETGRAVGRIDEDDEGEFFITCNDGPVCRLPAGRE